jgi:chaperone required for assembly of F1-ATPase
MISSLEMLTGITKSVILSLSFLTGDISKDEYHLIAESEEYFQKKVYGKVKNNLRKIF